MDWELTGEVRGAVSWCFTEMPRSVLIPGFPWKREFRKVSIFYKYQNWQVGCWRWKTILSADPFIFNPYTYNWSTVKGPHPTFCSLLAQILNKCDVWKCVYDMCQACEYIESLCYSAHLYHVSTNVSSSNLWIRLACFILAKLNVSFRASWIRS